MRRRLLLSAATILCCGYSSLAYSQHALTGSPTLAPQLYLAQSGGTEQLIAEDDATSEATNNVPKQSPFDLFGPDGTQVSERDQYANVPQQPVVDTGNSVPVGRHHRPSAAVNAAGVHVEPAYFPPIDHGSYQRRSPNLIANYISQEWCVDGLWSNYAAEREAQCAKQAQRIAGRQQHCGQCGHSGCYQQPAPANCGPHGCGAQHGHFRHFGSGRHFQRGEMFGPAVNQGCSECTAPQSAPSCGCAQVNPATNGMQPQFVNSRIPQDLPPPPQVDGNNVPAVVNGRVASQVFNPLNIAR